MSKRENSDFIKKHTLDIGEISFYKKYLIVRINNGVSLDYESASPILELAYFYYSDQKPFVYITDRINSYSFNPTAHFTTTRNFPNVKGYAVVAHNSLKRNIAVMEQQFLDIPKKIFTSVDDAIEWAEQIINNYEGLSAKL